MKLDLSLLSAFSILSLIGCIDEATPDEELLLDETAQEVGWTSLSGLYQTQTTGEQLCNFRSCTKPLGPASDRTCFLAGLKGSLSEGSSSYPSGAAVTTVDYGSGPQWQLHMLNPYGSGIAARVICINNKANRIMAQAWQSTTPVQTIAASTGSKRRCFLGGVYNYTRNSFAAFDTDVTIKRNSNNTHTVGGSFPPNSNVRVFTTCVDLDVNLGYGDWANGTANPVSSVTATNDGGVGCGLTGIGGHVETMSQGVDLNYNSPQWVWSISAFGVGHSHCFK